MVSVDPLLDRRFDRNHYQCAHFTVEAWRHLVGDDISDGLKGLLRPVKEKVVDPFYMRKHFKALPKPESPSIVLMMRKGQSPHLGVYWKRRILHLSECGVRHDPVDIATLTYKKVRYYKCR